MQHCIALPELQPSDKHTSCLFICLPSRVYSQRTISPSVNSSPSQFNLFSWLVLVPVFVSLDAVCSLAHLSSIQFKLTFHKSPDTRYNRCIRNMQAEVKKWFLIITTPIISALLINIKWSIILPACPVWHKNSRSLRSNTSTLRYL